MRVLGIDVPPSGLARWRAWVAPEVQPFLVDPALAAAVPGLPARELPLELADTYRLWGADPSLATVWLDEPTFMGLPRSTRAALVRAQVGPRRGHVPTVKAWGVGHEQADGHRFVWWPSTVTDAAVIDHVVDGQPDSCHRAADFSSPLVPRARELAGRFPDCSGPNCFGAVLAACGVAGAEEAQVVREPFEDWLAAVTRPGGRDDDAGTVLVWRTSEGLVDHAAVTLGGGFAFEKGAQTWAAPWWVQPVSVVKRLTRQRGLRLIRYRLQP